MLGGLRIADVEVLALREDVEGFKLNRWDRQCVSGKLCWNLLPHSPTVFGLLREPLPLFGLLVYLCKANDFVETTGDATDSEEGEDACGLSAISFGRGIGE